MTESVAESTVGHPIIARLREKLGDGIIASHSDHGDATAVVSTERYKEAVAFLRDDPQCSFDFLTDLAGWDRINLKQRPRFEIVLHLYSSARNERFRLKTQPADDANPVLDSIVDLYPAANWPEREVWDMFGVKFIGHPNLKRILMYEEFVGHPLRKDYPVNKRQPLVDEMPIEGDRPVKYFYT